MLRLILSLFLFLSFAHADGAPQEWASKIGQIFENRIQSKLCQQAMVGLSYDGASKLFAFSPKELSKAGLPSPNSLFEIGSITKSFTGILLAEIILGSVGQANQVGLDDKAQKF